MSSTPRWLVTGAHGQLGRSFAACAQGRAVELVGLSREELDIGDKAEVERVLAEVRPDVVLNAAAHTAVDACEDDRESAFRINGEGPGLLARACGPDTRLIHVSTEYVFDGRASTPLGEDASTEPLSVYGQSKLEGERAVRAAGERHLIVRTQWLFGPGANFVQTMLRLARQGGPLRVVEDQIGRPTWTGALADAILRAQDAGVSGVLHLACEGVTSWYDFAREIVQEAERRGWVGDVAVEPVSTAEFPRPARRPAYAVLGLERARSHGLGLPHWSEALRRYLDAEEERA